MGMFHKFNDKAVSLYDKAHRVGGKVLAGSALGLAGAQANAADYTGLTIDLTGADAAMIGIATAVLGALGVLLVIKLVKRAAS